MDVRNFRLADLKPYEKNPRKNDNAVDAVANSIKQFGFKVPLVVDTNNVIVCGHTRYKAAKSLGLESVPCVVADDLTAEQVKAFRLIDNKTSELASWDFEKLGEELNSLSSELVGAFELALPPQDDPLHDEIPSHPPTPKTAGEFESTTFFFTAEQKQAVETALAAVAGEIKETFGNKNKKGNALFEVVRQWAELKKSS